MILWTESIVTTTYKLFQTLSIHENKMKKSIEYINIYDDNLDRTGPKERPVRLGTPFQVNGHLN